MEEIYSEVPPLPYMQPINRKLITHDEEHHYAYECPINPQPNSNSHSPTQAYHIHKLPPECTLSNTPINPKSMFDRSLSLPAFRKLLSFNYRPKPSESLINLRSFGSCSSLVLLNEEHGSDIGMLTSGFDGEGTEVLKEEAICRICMLELDEGNETFKMECSCKGELALAHRECTIKWFSIKGNNQCDICNSQVCNLPVLLFRRSTSMRQNNDPYLVDEVVEETSSWRHMTMSILSSMLEALWHKLEELSEFP